MKSHLKASKTLYEKLIINILRIGNRIPFILPDKIFLKLKFRYYIGRKLDLQNPLSYNEKIQWLKLYDRKPEYHLMADKVEAKKYVAHLIGNEHIIPTLGVWHKFEEIDFDKLPDKFVLKATHGCGGVIICKNKTRFDKEAARKEINASLKRDYFNYGREWPYKNLKRRIIAEPFLVDESGVELKDYKFFCFNGVPKALFVATDRPFDTRFDFFDINFNHLPFINGHENSIKPILKPMGYEKMVEIAARLSQNLPHIRVDLYNISGKIYFGELTFYHWGGMIPFEPEDWDYKFGQWLNLPIKPEPA